MTTLVVVRRDDPSSGLALETALELGDSEIVAVMIDTEEYNAALRAAVAVGADRAIRLGPPVPEPTSGVEDGAALVPLIEELNPELVLCGGRRGKLGSYGAGSALGELIGWSHVGSVARVERVDRGLEVQRRREGVLDTVLCPLPAVLSIEWGPPLRYPTLPGRFRARRSNIEVKRAGTPPKARVAAIARTGPKPLRKLAQRSGPGLDHVLGLLLGGAEAGGSASHLSGDPEEVASRVVVACTDVLRGV